MKRRIGVIQREPRDREQEDQQKTRHREINMQRERKLRQLLPELLHLTQERTKTLQEWLQCLPPRRMVRPTVMPTGYPGVPCIRSMGLAVGVALDSKKFWVSK